MEDVAMPTLLDAIQQRYSCASLSWDKRFPRASWTCCTKPAGLRLQPLAGALALHCGGGDAERAAVVQACYDQPPPRQPPL